MRQNGYITNLWNNGGPFIGSDRPNAVVTVEPDWFLNEESNPPYVTRTRAPMRWFQRANNSQTERVIPNIKSISIDRGIDSDAGAVEIVMVNQKMKENEEPGQINELGSPGYYCVDEKTELLSKRGWLGWDSVRVGDKILTLNCATGVSEWLPVDDVFVGDYSGKMIQMNNRGLDALVTDGHRWPVTYGKRRRRGKGKYDLVEVENLVDHHEIPLRAPGPDATEVHSDDFVRLIGWVVTEGSLRTNGKRVTIYQSPSKNPIKCAMIEGAISNLTDKWSINSSSGINGYRFSGDLARRVREVVPHKKLTYNFISEISVRQRRLLIDVIVMGDGHWAAEWPAPSIYSGDSESADLYQALCVLAGYGSRVSSRIIKTSINGYDYESEEWEVKQRVRSHVTRSRISIDSVDYSGKVWCPSTKNGTFLARRNGHSYFTGNTFNRGHNAAHRQIWNQHPNDWFRILRPGMLIRTYQGYGGHTYTGTDSWRTAVTTGNLMQTGTWIIDDISVNTDGIMTMRGRDTGALLIDQILYPPLVPKACYPTRFWKPDFGWDLQPISGTGNYLDITDIVELLLLWSGFWLKGATNRNPFRPDKRGKPVVFGNLESTGLLPDEPIGEDVFDKRPVIDPINQLKEIVGYVVWVDQEGAFHFESPNVWGAGNRLYSGIRVDDTFDLHERRNLLSYSAATTKKYERSAIWITTDEPTLNIPGATTRLWQNPHRERDNNANYMYGMHIPGMVKVPIDLGWREMGIMAELLGMHMWFARRRGNARILANPCIDVNDQVRIVEKTTAEVYVHYVRGVRSEQDLDQGTYFMDLDTSWLGDKRNWTVRVTDTGHVVYMDEDEHVKLSQGAWQGHHTGEYNIGRKTA